MSQAESDRWSRVAIASAAIALLLAPAAHAAAGSAPSAPGAVRHIADVDPALSGAHGPTKVIVTADDPAAVIADLYRVDGTVNTPLPLISGFAATVPGERVAELGRDPRVRAVTADGAMHVQSDPGTDASASATAPASSTPSDVATLPSVYRQVVGADSLAAKGAQGDGVTVALLDTGITPGSDLADRVVPITAGAIGTAPAACVNFSGETTCDDTYGHGTFLAGLIAGDGTASGGKYRGVAPHAKLLSLKLSGADGSADVSKVLAAIQWVVSFRDQYGIRVLNLSLGTDSTQSYRVDPLDFAVEQAWRAGIVVNVAASNRGPGASTISKPGDDPYVLTVGAIDDRGTAATTDDLLPDFSSRGPTAADHLSKPDVVAPGAHLVSLAAPGATISTTFPSTMPAPYRRGSGTSMATAVVSGLVADLLSANGTMTPDRVKFALTSTAGPTASADALAVGSGIVDGNAALAAGPGFANQGLGQSDGHGSLALSRGTVRVQLDDRGGRVVVDGEQTAQLRPWASVIGDWTGSSWTGSSWTGSSWTGSSWTGSSWTGSSWTGSSWTGSSWTGSSWTGSSWTGSSWTGNTWYGSSWTGSQWYGAWDK